MTYDYDKSIVDRLIQSLGDDRIKVAPADSYLDTVARLSEDTITLPLVSVSRVSTIIDTSKINHGLAIEGCIASDKQVPLSTEDLKRLQAIPIRINYQLDIWSWSREENDALTRELVWMYIQYPTHRVVIPYGLNVSHNFNVFIDSDIEDNSDVVNHGSRGEYFRQTISMYTDDAYLWKTSKYVKSSIDININIT